MRVWLKVALVALVLATVAASEASACSAKCVKVAPFCRRCLDVGTVTNITCEDIGDCGCVFTQNTCGSFTSNTTEAAALVAPDTVTADEPASCLAQAADELARTLALDPADAP